MSKELDELKRRAEQDEKNNQARHKERYQYARSLGVPAIIARHLEGSSKEKILRISKDLKDSKK